MKWNGTDLEQIVHYCAGGEEWTACGIYAATMTADTRHAVTADPAAVTCDTCRVRCAEPEETLLDAVKRGARQTAEWRRARRLI